MTDKVKSKRSIMSVRPLSQAGALMKKSSEDNPKKNPSEDDPEKNPSRYNPPFNLRGWRIWFIGFLIPVLVLGVVPLGKFITDPKYTGAGWVMDTFSNFNIVIISFSMILSAITEYISGSQEGKTKTSFANFMETFLFLGAAICLIIYTAVITVAAGWNEELQMKRVFLINIFLFFGALALGTVSFIRRFLWK